MPKLDAPSIGPLVASILANRLARDKMTQESIADTIKNVRDERQSGEYLDAMKAAGLIPQDYDAGGLGGAKLGTGLAQMIQHQQEFQAREEHRRAMEARIGGRGRGGSGGGGGGGSGSGYPETTWDDQGREWRPGPGGRWIPVTSPHGSGTSGGAAGPKPQTQDQIMREQAKLLEEKDQMDQEIASQRAANTAALKPDVPYTRSGQYNRTVNRLKQLQQMPGMPTTDAPGAVSTPRVTDDTGADTGAVVPPLLARPDASKGAPVNLPQVGDQRPGPNGTTVEWDGHGWKIVE
jgi:hypothetical protein